jgi:diguanylate cyclase (GGDEF)-like protein
MTTAASNDTGKQTQEHSSLRRGPLPWLILCGLVLIAVIAVVTAMMVDNYRRQAVKNEETNLDNTVSMLAHHFDQQLSDFVAAQKQIVSEVRSKKITTPSQLAAEMGTVEQHKMLCARISNTSDIAGLNIYGADGQLINSSKVWPVPSINIADRDYFKELKSDTGPEPYRMEQLQSRFSGKWTTAVVYRISGPNDEFLGVVIRGLYSEVLEDFFSSVSPTEDSAISMYLHGALLARFPHAEGLMGTKLNMARLFARILAEQGRFTTTITSPIDGKERLIAARRLEHFPLSVAATATVRATLAPWREQTTFLVGVAALSALVIAGVVSLMIRQLSVFHGAAQERVRLEKQRLDFAVNNMSHGLLLFDSEARLAVCNDRYIEMFSLSRDVAKAGCTLNELLRHRQETGTFNEDVDTHCARFFKMIRGTVAKKVLDVSDGRTIELCHRPTSDGGWVTTTEDITERRQAESRIAHLAHYDALTDLPNRTLFREQLELELRALEDNDNSVAVLYIDVDEFKSINDSLGHVVGDALLKSIAVRLSECVSNNGSVARLGGDEFAVVCIDMDEDGVGELTRKLQDAIRTPYECLGHRLTTDSSIGIAIAPKDGRSLDELLKNADLAMYAAKAGGRRTFRFFEPSMEARIKERIQLEADLRQAISAGQLEVHYQPLLNLSTNAITGCEALVRWRHPTRGYISPAEFIPLAEERGLVVEIGEWVLKTACAEAATWPCNIKVAVNVSPVQFRSSAFSLHVISALAGSGLAAQRLELEITEAVLISDDDTALKILHQLRLTGVRIALDDFGTGYSSLSYLQRFPFDKIKIDRCFVDNIDETEASSCIVRAVVSIAKARNMTTTAEGVETPEQQALVRNLGCTEMQGFVFSGAKPAGDIAELIRVHTGHALVA